MFRPLLEQKQQYENKWNMNLNQKYQRMFGNGSVFDNYPHGEPA